MRKQGNIQGNHCVGIRFRRFVVMLVDILGQREAIKELENLPTLLRDQDPRGIEIIRASLGVRDKVRTLAQCLWDVMRTRTVPPRILRRGPAVAKSVKRLYSYRLGLQMFGDTLVFFAPLHVTRNQLSPLPVLDLIQMGAGLMNSMLGDRIPIRGAIAVGIGAASRNDSELYGPAFLDAYKIEQDIAQYPRIVMSQTVLDYLDTIGAPEGQDDHARLCRALSEGCRGFLRQDDDGLHVLDHLGAACQNTRAVQSVQDGLRFVREEHARFVRKRDYKLAGRYGRLRRYYEQFAPLWVCGNGDSPEASTTDQQG